MNEHVHSLCQTVSHSGCPILHFDQHCCPCLANTCLLLSVPLIGAIPVNVNWYWCWFFFYFTILYWFCHISTCIRHRCTRVPHPEPSSHVPPHTIPLGHPSAPAPSIQYHASNLDWQFISYTILYMFQCYSFKSFHTCLLPQSPKYCSIYLCLFCYLIHRVIVTIFLNSIYMC